MKKEKIRETDHVCKQLNSELRALQTSSDQINSAKGKSWAEN